MIRNPGKISKAALARSAILRLPQSNRKSREYLVRAWRSATCCRSARPGETNRRTEIHLLYRRPCLVDDFVRCPFDQERDASRANVLRARPRSGSRWTTVFNLCRPLLRSASNPLISTSGRLTSANVYRSCCVGIGSGTSLPSGRIGLGIPP